ncbi:hypothetical protein AK830_g541 [Neonectria ditissima]|uniref:Uncharacterized protein n=1 Tax=Neonectria ditissima TaxID=78410 RepID=A0A0P7B7G3_9HYPO|nr:hypothetical protein AK830_g541 [Neonectria ditissima]
MRVNFLGARTSFPESPPKVALRSPISVEGNKATMPPNPSAGSTYAKSPKIPHRVKTPEQRQVHFSAEDGDDDATLNGIWGGRTHGITTANSPSGGFSAPISGGGKTSSGNAPGGILKTSGGSDEVDPTPSRFPQVGAAPTSFLQLHTAADPSLSLNHQPTSTYSYGAPQVQHQQHHQHQQFLVNSPSFTQHHPTTPITYIGVTHQPHQAAATMGDYQNAAPPVNGLHFQPPVPDTTFGPIPHVYVPRFDGGFVPGVQVRPPSVSFIPAPVVYTAACTTVAVPKLLLSVALCLVVVQPNVGHMAPQPAHNGYVVTQQPYYVQQPVMGQQPVMINNQPHFMPQAQHMAGMPVPGMPGGAAVTGGYPVYAGNNGHIPEVAGVGRTAGEEQLRQIKFAYENRLHEPQDFKPADDDPSRFYYVHEVDGNWTQRSRFTIDNLGDCRWYVTNDGWFYASRMPN